MTHATEIRNEFKYVMLKQSIGHYSLSIVNIKKEKKTVSCARYFAFCFYFVQFIL